MLDDLDIILLRIMVVCLWFATFSGKSGTWVSQGVQKRSGRKQKLWEKSVFFSSGIMCIFLAILL